MKIKTKIVINKSIYSNLLNSLLFVILFIVPNLYDQDIDTDPLIQNVMGREAVSLDGQWGVIIDSYETDYYDYRYQPSEYGYFRDQKMQKPSDLIEYNFDTAQRST